MAEDVIDWQEEMEKCKNDPYYFYQKYITIEGGSKVSREEFDAVWSKRWKLVISDTWDKYAVIKNEQHGI